ncbi:MAG: D-glycero-beta-D-manno-heptose-7-phosphate kinase [Deltaproteobacteria bacterium]
MDIAKIIRRFSQFRVSVAGDLMLDRYIWGAVNRISPEAPVPVLDVSSENTLPGGAANVARNLKSLGAEVNLFGSAGGDSDGANLLLLLANFGVGADGVIINPEKPTTTKTRLIAENQQITRIDREDVSPISEAMKSKVIEKFAVSLEINPPDALIISDYNKGLFAEDLLREIIALARKRKILIAVDPKGADFSKYRGADIITPNQKEAEQAVGFSIGDEKSAGLAIDALAQRAGVKTALITRGRLGISFRADSGAITTVSSEAREVFDVTGAGDTVIAAFTLSYLASGDLETSVRIANRSAGIVVGRVGAATVTQEDLLRNFRNDGSRQASKILLWEHLAQSLLPPRAKGQRVVFTNGCFDLLHAGHLEILKRAKALGDVLVVGVNSDASVRRLKGDARPIVGEADRAAMLAALECVDYAVIFHEDTPINLIREIKPDVLVKGGDYAAESVAGADEIKSWGGEMVLVPLIEGVSTSALIERMRRRGGSPD